MYIIYRPIKTRTFFSAIPVIAWLIRAALVILSIGIVGCDEGVIVFEAGSNAHTDVDENTSGAVWSAKAKVTGTSNATQISYDINGPDADLFLINPVTGVVSFKTPVDFETPTDADKNNEYLFIITAGTGPKSAVQQVALMVKNVTLPVVEFVRPKPFENVSFGKTVELETLVRFYDKESNTPIQDASVLLNSIELSKVANSDQMWSGKMTISQLTTNLNVVGLQGGVTRSSANTIIFNKPNALNPSYFGNFSDNGLGIVTIPFEISNVFAKVDLINKQITAQFKFYEGEDLETARLYDLTNPDGIKGGGRLQIAAHAQRPIWYGLIQGNSIDQTQSIIRVSEDPSFASVWLFNIADHAIDLAIDEHNQRLVILSRQDYGQGDQFRLSARRLDPIGPMDLPQPSLLQQLPATHVTGKLKDFGIDGLSETYIFADERQIDGQLKTLVQGFSAEGVQNFATFIGPDISNMVIHSAAGVLYVAENSRSSSARVVAINMVTGAVEILFAPEECSQCGAFTSLGLDAARNRLVIGDTVSDAIYLVDLKTRQLQELDYIYLPSIVIESIEIGVEN